MEILRKARNILSLAFLALAPAYAACSGGDPCASDMDCKRSESCVENTCELLDDLSAEHENPCGNSEMYGQYLVSPINCKIALHMREDCGIDFAEKNPEYHLLLTGSVELRKNFELGFPPEYISQRVTYFGQNIIVPGVDQSRDETKFDPEYRFSTSDEGRYHMGTKSNEFLDRFGGYVGNPWNGDYAGQGYGCNDDPDDCFFFIVTDGPYQGKEACKESPYHLSKGD